jgi:hypothetical protein
MVPCVSHQSPFSHEVIESANRGLCQNLVRPAAV